MKTIGNHIAWFKNIYMYLRKMTKSKIRGAFTCLLTVCKSVNHGGCYHKDFICIIFDCPLRHYQPWISNLSPKLSFLPFTCTKTVVNLSYHRKFQLQRTYISMFNGTFQSIFYHVTYVTTCNYFIIETYSFTVPKRTVDVRSLCKRHLFLWLAYALIWTFCVDILGY